MPSRTVLLLSSAVKAGGMRVSKKLENAPVERSPKIPGKEKIRYVHCWGLCAT